MKEPDGETGERYHRSYALNQLLHLSPEFGPTVNSYSTKDFISRPQSKFEDNIFERGSAVNNEGIGGFVEIVGRPCRAVRFGHVVEVVDVIHEFEKAICTCWFGSLIRESVTGGTVKTNNSDFFGPAFLFGDTD